MGFGIVMENLKGMKKQIRYGKRMNRRLHTLPYRRLQSYIEYKAKLAGLPAVYVNPVELQAYAQYVAGNWRRMGMTSKVQEMRM